MLLVDAVGIVLAVAFSSSAGSRAGTYLLGGVHQRFLEFGRAMASAHAKITQTYVARTRAGCEYTAADPIIRERPARSRHRQCLGSNRPAVTRCTALLGLTARACPPRCLPILCSTN